MVTQHDAQRPSAQIPPEHRVHPHWRVYGLYPRHLDRSDDVTPESIAATKDRARAGCQQDPLDPE